MRGETDTDRQQRHEQKCTSVRLVDGISCVPSVAFIRQKQQRLPKRQRTNKCCNLINVYYLFLYHFNLSVYWKTADRPAGGPTFDDPPAHIAALPPGNEASPVRSISTGCETERWNDGWPCCTGLHTTPVSRFAKNTGLFRKTQPNVFFCFLSVLGVLGYFRFLFKPQLDDWFIRVYACFPQHRIYQHLQNCRFEC